MAALAIGNFIQGAIVQAISAAAPHVATALTEKYCPELVQNLNRVMEAQKQSEARVKATINSTMLFQMTQPILDDIKHWSKEVEPALSRVGLGDSSDWNTLRKKVRDEVSHHLDTLHMYLLGNSERPGAQVGIIAQFMQDNHAKLAEGKNWDYHLADYILEVENMVKYYMAAQSTAYALRVLFIDEIDIKLKNVTKWEAELVANFASQAAFAFRTYPAFIRKLMPSAELGARPTDKKLRRFLRLLPPAVRYLTWEHADEWFWVVGNQDNNGDAAKAHWYFSNFFDESGTRSAGGVELWNSETRQATHWVYPPSSPAEAVVRLAEGTMGHGISARSRAYGRGAPIKWKIIPAWGTGELAAFKFLMEPELVPAQEYWPHFLQLSMVADNWALEDV